jgi:hypothetical protein
VNTISAVKSRHHSAYPASTIRNRNPYLSECHTEFRGHLTSLPRGLRRPAVESDSRRGNSYPGFGTAQGEHDERSSTYPERCAQHTLRDSVHSYAPVLRLTRRPILVARVMSVSRLGSPFCRGPDRTRGTDCPPGAWPPSLASASWPYRQAKGCRQNRSALLALPLHPHAIMLLAESEKSPKHTRLGRVRLASVFDTRAGGARTGRERGVANPASVTFRVQRSTQRPDELYLLPSLGIACARHKS